MKRLVSESKSVELKSETEPPQQTEAQEPGIQRQSHISETQMLEVPPSSLHGRSLKKLKSYKDIRSAYKMNNMKAIFINDLQFVLKEFKPCDHQLDDDLLLTICNLCESYFYYPHRKEDRERIKLEVIETLMLKYFHNDIQLLHKTIGHVSHRVKKSKMIGRVFSRLKLYFFKKA